MYNEYLISVVVFYVLRHAYGPACSQYCYIHLRKKCIFEINIDSHAVGKNNTEKNHVHFTHFTLTTFYKTCTDTDFDSVNIQSISIPMRIPHGALLQPQALLPLPNSLTTTGLYCISVTLPYQ